MNRMMKKIAAVLLAAACIPVTGLTAGANYCETNWSFFEDMEEFDDHGMLRETDDTESKYFIHTYRNPLGLAYYSLIRATPIHKVIRFTAREELTCELADEIAETLDTVLPGIREGFKGYSFTVYELDSTVHPGYDYSYHCEQASLYCEIGVGHNDFHLYFKDEPENAAELEASILLALAKKHLISEFYGFDQTVQFSKGSIGCGGDYYTEEQLRDPDEATLARMERDSLPLGCLAYIVYADRDYKEVLREIDLDAIQAYLDVHYPGYTVETFETQPFPHNDPDGVERMITQPRFRIAGAEELSFVQQVELLCELWEKFDLPVGVSYDLDSSEVNSGNALAKKGDVTLDTDIGITDVIALNRNIMTGDLLCDTAKQNADINGNGTPDETDSLNLLKYIVGINETLG
ncbi:MAG: dockerin type I repeat-containing protein [Oscillospiraceae bacterium]|nr:dockerin type I repeat-containing protein [Oscillospiraceae bacterium]